MGDERAGVEEWTAHLREHARPGPLTASRTTASTPLLSSESIHRTTAVLRAYANILDSTVHSSSSSSSSDASRLSTLAESSAREVGWSIEENVEGWLVENGMVSPEPSSDSSSNAGSSDSEDSEDERMGPKSVGMDRAEGVSAQEAEMQASRLVDEWYEACPTCTWRWVLAEHATAILVSELQDVDAPYSVWETLLGVCVERGAYSEAARLHRPFIQSTLALPSPATASTTHILDACLLTPSPRALLHSALLPALLSSAFEDRFFYHSFLTLSPSKIGQASDTAIEVLCVLGEVAAKMVSTLQELRDEESEEGDEAEEDAFGDMVDEVLARMAKQIKAALPFLLDSPSPSDTYLIYNGSQKTGNERTGRLERLAEIVGHVLDAVDVSRADANGAMGELVALATVIDFEVVVARYLHDLDYRASPDIRHLDQLLTLAFASDRTSRSPSSASSATSDSSEDAESSHVFDVLRTYLLPSRPRSIKRMEPSTSRKLDDIFLVVQDVMCASGSTDSRQRRRDDFVRCLLSVIRRVPHLDDAHRGWIKSWLAKLDGRRAPFQRRDPRPERSPSPDEEQTNDEQTDYEETPEPTRAPKRSQNRASPRALQVRHDRVSRSRSLPHGDDIRDADSDVEIVEPAFSLARTARQSIRASSTASAASSSSSRGSAKGGRTDWQPERRRLASVDPVRIVVLEPSPSPDLPSPSAPISRSSASSAASTSRRAHRKPHRPGSPDGDVTPTSSEPDDLDLLRSARRRPAKRPPRVRNRQPLAPPAPPKPRSAGMAPPSPSPSGFVEKEIGRRRRLENQDRQAPAPSDSARRRAHSSGMLSHDDRFVDVKRRRYSVEGSSEDELAL